jgi:hypothetical protein
MKTHSERQATFLMTEPHAARPGNSRCGVFSRPAPPPVVNHTPTRRADRCSDKPPVLRCRHDPAGRCSDKPPVLRCRHDPRPDHSDYGDFSSGPRVGAARPGLGVLLTRHVNAGRTALQVSARGNRARPTDPGHELITRGPPGAKRSPSVRRRAPFPRSASWFMPRQNAKPSPRCRRGLRNVSYSTSCIGSAT